MASKKASTTKRTVVVCTAKRGVFFGSTSDTGIEIVTRGTVTLARARMCTYWSKETRGVLGLAGIGPQPGSRIGPEVPELCLNEITAVYTCTPEAISAWRAGPWT